MFTKVTFIKNVISILKLNIPAVRHFKSCHITKLVLYIHFLSATGLLIHTGIPRVIITPKKPQCTGVNKPLQN